MRQTLLATLLLASLCSCAMLSPPARHPGYVVFFSERSAVIEPEAMQSIAAAAAQATATGTPVTVIGWTDSAGSPQADVTLSQQRAQNVAAALAADGVPPARIMQLGRGQTGEDPGVASRRVEIDLGS